MPREWQIAALRAWHANSSRGTVAVVTGAGKTIFAEMCMLRILDEAPRSRFVIVVPTLALIDQWALSLREDLGVAGDEIAVFAEGNLPSPARVNLMTMVSARAHAPRLTDGGPTMLIVDECHRIASEENSRALDADYSAALGLSATPEREYDEAFETIVAPTLGPIIFRYAYPDALRDSVISPFRLVNVRVSMMDDERTAYVRLSKQVAQLLSRQRRGEPVDQPLKRALQRRSRIAAMARMRVPVATNLIARRPPERTLVFHESIAEAESIRRLLVGAGRRVSIYHSRLGSALRLDNLRMYRQGVVDVLVTCRALDEGINVPDTTLGIIASGTGSTRQRIQRLGRILRPAPGKDDATMITLYASDIEERRLASEAADNPAAVEVSWLSGDSRRA